MLTHFLNFVLVNPYIVSSPASEIQVQNVGDTVKLNCSADGSPLPKVTWFKDGQHVISTSVHDRSDLTTSEVVIHRFKPSDTGVYTCLFYNDKNTTATANTSLSMSISYLFPLQFMCSYLQLFAVKCFLFYLSLETCLALPVLSCFVLRIISHIIDQCQT